MLLQKVQERRLMRGRKSLPMPFEFPTAHLSQLPARCGLRWGSPPLPGEVSLQGASMSFVPGQAVAQGPYGGGGM